MPRLRRLLRLKGSRVDVTEATATATASVDAAPADVSTAPGITAEPAPIPPALCLPVEIWLEILHHVGPQPHYTYTILARVCKLLNDIVTPLLYEALILPAWQLPDEPKLKSAIIAKAWSTRQFGMFCQDAVAWRYALMEKRVDGMVRQLYLADILNAIPNGQLHSFIWSCCIPFPKMLYDAIIDRQQNISTLWLNIQDLKLPTFDNHIPEMTEPVSTEFDFSRFPNLRHLSLHGSMDSTRDYLTNILSSIAPIFKNLKTFTLGSLEVTYGPHMHHGEADTRLYAADKSSLSISYPTLETLAFDLSAGTRFTLQHLKLQRLSQLPNLKSLYARNNIEGMRLLRHIDPAVPIRLTTLHVDCCRNEILSDFLHAFQGLVDLDIVTSAQEDYTSARPIINHSATLRRLSIRNPIPIGLLHSLGDHLDKLEELCATLCKSDDPFSKGRFPNLRLLWIYAHPQEKSEPEFWWFPSTDTSTNKRKFRMPSSLMMQGTSTLALPKSLKTVAVGNYPRLDYPFQSAPFVYELIGRDFFITWKRVNLQQLAAKYPDFLSPYSNCMNTPVVKRQMRFQVHDEDGEHQNLISFANQTSEPHIPVLYPASTNIHQNTDANNAIHIVEFV
ncbi:hypothetical protein Dda_5347 [Drechslerella dactyloides]|uniref:F-box domain-containing protein n=1 Tax=Drechslerella dactyloides TaxID=74499 RepID=A0AAD6IW13_DREDA|nr:hypothetical protein Dda_5347 [Drechslerella dactyloides]